MKKTTTALLIATTVSSLLFSTAPAFASNPTQCPTYSPGPTECNTSSTSLGVLKGQPLEAPKTETYPAPVVTPNTVNGVVPEAANPTPAPAPTVAAQGATTLPNTGVTGLMYVWGAVGGLALAVGLASVYIVKRKAKA